MRSRRGAVAFSFIALVKYSERLLSAIAIYQLVYELNHQTSNMLLYLL